MKRIFYFLLAVFWFGLSVSCSKESSSKEPETSLFEVDGVGYSTLQQAADVAGGISDAVITLMRDGKGEGVLITDEYLPGITIDFQSFTYTLEKGCSIAVENNSLNITASGGSVESSDSTPAMALADSADVVLSGSLSIVAEKTINAVDGFVFTNGFTGEVDGNITLNGSKFYLFDSGCSVKSDVLVVKGNDAAFIADVAACTSGCTAKFAKVVSILKYPVVSVEEGVISVGEGNVHIHKMVSRNVPGTCISSDYSESSCAECGYTKVEPLESFGKCPTESLVHHQPKEATDAEYGNAEYWHCPLCGKVYGSSDGKLELEEVPLSFPKLYIAGRDLLYDPDFVVDWGDEQEQSNAITIAGFGFVLGCISLVNGIQGTIRSWVTRDNSQWRTTFTKLREIKSQLAEVDKKINALIKETEQIPDRILISNRNAKVSYMKFQTYYADSCISKYLGDNTLSDDQKADLIEQRIKHWGSQIYEKSEFYDCTYRLLEEFHTSSSISGSMRPVPELWEDFANSLCFWEHEGYNFRSKMQVNDIALLSKAWCMTMLYYTSIKKYSDPSTLTRDTTKFRALWNQYAKDCMAMMNRMKERKDKIRRMNSENISFNIPSSAEYGYKDFATWFSADANRKKYYFPRDNGGDKAVNSCKAVLEHYFGKKGYMTQQQAQKIYSYYNRNKERKDKVSIYTILRDTLGFTHLPKTYGDTLSSDDSPHILFTRDTEGFRSRLKNNKPEIAMPMCYMWAWESWRCPFYIRDKIGIHTCIKDDATVCVNNIFIKSNIRSYGDYCGWIKDPGDKTGNRFTTILAGE